MQETEAFLSSKYKYVVIVLVIGIVVGVVLLLSRLNKSTSSIEVVNSATLEPATQMATASAMLVAEISGAVKNPGVYKFSTGARIDDLLIASGGLGEDADQGWVEKYINKASKIIDGQKVFVPAKGSSTQAPIPPQAQINHSEVLSATNQGEGVEASTVPSGLININTSSKPQLESLWGIGPVTAQKIIEQRPYSDVSELIKRKIVKSNVYERIKDQISVY